jgi:hypothetical protein
LCGIATDPVYVLGSILLANDNPVKEAHKQCVEATAGADEVSPAECLVEGEQGERNVGRRYTVCMKVRLADVIDCPGQPGAWATAG